LKTLRVSNSSHSLKISFHRFHFGKKLLTSGHSFSILNTPPRVAGFEVFFSGRFWVFGDTLVKRCVNEVQAAATFDVSVTLSPSLN
jgi:hypothetical protein